MKRGDKQSPYGAPRHRRLTQHQRRRGNSLRPAANPYRQRPRGDVPGTLQQQDQWRHAAPMAATGEPGSCHKRFTDAIGDDWITNLSQLRELKPLAGRQRLSPRVPPSQAQRRRRQFAALAEARPPTSAVDPDSIFDCQIKRIHEYKRQLPQRAARRGALRPPAAKSRARHGAAHLLLRGQGRAGLSPLPSCIIKFINNLAGIDRRRSRGERGRLKVVFLPEYYVSLAERLIPASRRVESDLDRGLRSQRHQQHEVHDERRAHHRHARRGDDRDGARGGRGKFLPLRPDRAAGRRQHAAGTTRSGTTTTSPRRAQRSI